jgi:hypothetical protein
VLIKKSYNNLYAVPNINLSYPLKNGKNLTANLSWDADDPSLANTYLNSLLIGYRSIHRNQPISTPVQTFKWGANYTFTNTEKATSFILSYYHSASSKSEIEGFTFTNDFDYSVSRFAAVKQKIDNFYIKFDKYFFPLKTAIGFKHTLTWFDNPLQVNGNITSNRFFAYNADLSIRPTINKAINFNFGTGYKLNEDIISRASTFQLNPFMDIMFTVGKKFSLGGRCNYFYSNFSPLKHNYFFGNLYAWYSIKPKKIDAKLSLFNFLNTNSNLSGIATSVFTKSVTTQLLPRYGLIEISFKF